MTRAVDEVIHDDSGSDLEIVLSHHVESDLEVSNRTFLKDAEEARVKRRKTFFEHKESHVSQEAKASIRQVTGTRELPAIILSDSEEDKLEEKQSDSKTIKGTVLNLHHQVAVAEQQKLASENHSTKTLDLAESPSEASSMNTLYQTDFPKSSGEGPRSSIRLLCDLSNLHTTNNSDENVDVVSLASLLGSPNLLETYQFNFSVQLPMFLSFLGESFATEYKNIVFITGSSIFESATQKSLIRKKFNVSEAVAPLPNRFASHHTKMMVNFYDNGDAEVIIMTCNLTQLDICGLTQALWKSGRIKKGPTTTTSGRRFRFDLLRYLSRYGLNETKRLVSVLEKFDFSSVDVELVASAPGVYNVRGNLSTAECYGYAKLRQVLERNNLLIENTDSRHNILSQVTSLAYPYTSQRGNTSSVFSHILCPLMFKTWQHLVPGGKSFEDHQKEHNYVPHIIFPTKKDVLGSKVGFLSGAAIHFKYESSIIHKAQYEQNIKKYLRKWTTPGDITGRENLTPHVKYYTCDNGDDWKLLKWVMVGSHNLSKQAWGYPKPKSNGNKMDISSYELSVLIPQDKDMLVPTYKTDTTVHIGSKPVRFPFSLPPMLYQTGDLPWTMEGL
ncbi:phospholipase D/nuclease [Metschnikowia bicuspidata var. bicuspidata NRRL YB-4993]|uniref:Phospholipase D/nuclease n=1 Tax=Metschnikowia bicuspidata var. bicuspidata NRRL YB-4993 TaxID=869754 RepID=A0A1A0HK99_9ASCO|nr:phospholipase D/nuclease [Metschnikowia bicuspidata var. bicuspidata NRRL YB-4993]OBA24312.1 phospholipase D/nuclease [Metschnikowia bicuspidata var. bicuspidata NRRL YB-4993]